MKLVEENLKILVIDDDEVDRMAFKKAFKRASEKFEIYEARDGHEALSILKNKIFDCIFLDYRLPGWDGIKVLKEIRNLGIKTPLVFITGQGDEKLVADIIKAGAEDYLPKSIMSSESLLKSLEYAIESQKAEEKLNWLASFPEKSPIPIIELDFKGNLNYINPAAIEILPDLKEKSFSHPFLEGVLNLAEKLKDKSLYPFVREIQIGERYYHQTISLIPEKDLIRIYAIDITERKKAENQILYDAFHDKLTGLFNKPFFMQRLRQLVENSKIRKEYNFAVLLLDIDRFKIINDSLGHSCGDELLINVGNKLKNCIRISDTLSRFGGDEFGVLIEDVEDTLSYATKVALKIQKEISEPFKIENHEVFVTVSIGISLSLTGYQDAEEMLRDADIALYRAKSLGRARYEVFDKEMHLKALSTLNLETDLRKAIEKKELDIHYQPILDLEKEKIVGFEALVRWNHPEKGILYPHQFLPLAEETGLIIQIDRWVLKNACFQTYQWQKRYSPKEPIFISVNLSSTHFNEPDLINYIENVLKETMLSPNNLKIEITENAIISNVQYVNSIIMKLRSLNVQLHLDDFGTGYSSLSYLQRFKVDTLKIDKSFIDDLFNSDESKEIVRTIIALSQNLKINVMAEGIETKEQLEFLKSLKCKFGQGFLFSKPLNANLINKMIERISIEEF